MTRPSIGQIIAAAWELAWRDSPWEPDHSLNHLLGLPTPTYRDRLDRPQRNYRSELIARITIVRNNIRALGPHLPPERLPD